MSIFFEKLDESVQLLVAVDIVMTDQTLPWGWENLTENFTSLLSTGWMRLVLAKRMAQFTQLGRKFVVHFFVESTDIFCASPLWCV